MNNKEYIKHLSPYLFKEAAPSELHDRMQRDLAAWAESKGFSVDIGSLPSGGKPDVFKSMQTDEKIVFLGDAKNSQFETPKNAATVRRLFQYMCDLAKLAGTGSITGVTFAVATDGQAEAEAWDFTLTILAVCARFENPAFQVQQIQDTQTWVIFW